MKKRLFRKFCDLCRSGHAGTRQAGPTARPACRVLCAPFGRRKGGKDLPNGRRGSLREQVDPSRGGQIAARLAAVAVLLGAVLVLEGCAEKKETARPGRPGPPGRPDIPSPARTLTLDLGGAVTMELVLIPAGEFMMGSPNSESGRESEEGPQHRVRITKPFYMGKYEVTQAQYERIMGKNPSKFKGASNPVEEVSWNDATEFCRKLSQRSGRKVRLPTEAEWEYACRAGSTTRFCFGDNDNGLGNYAWYLINSGGKTHPVGAKRANAWGLHDMHGNVWEWCADWDGLYPSGAVSDPSGPRSGSSRVLRGGSWHAYGRHCRSAGRYGSGPTGRCYSLGFRVAAAVAGP